MCCSPWMGSERVRHYLATERQGPVAHPSPGCDNQQCLQTLPNTHRGQNPSQLKITVDTA